MSQASLQTWPYKNSEVASVAIASDVNKAEKENSNKKGVKHAEIQPRWCPAGLSKTQRRWIQWKRLAGKNVVRLTISKNTRHLHCLAGPK
jgi:hypothetical protein